MSFGFAPLNILFFHANRLSRSRIGSAQARASIPASIFGNVSVDNFCHSVFLSFRPVHPGFWSEAAALRVRSENFGCARHSGHLREAPYRVKTVIVSIPF